MARARWNGEIIAESDRCEVVEGNVYFPADSVRSETLSASDTTSVCPRKGVARYYHVNAGGKQNLDAAWSYPDPMPGAEKIRGMIAFWKGVEVES